MFQTMKLCIALTVGIVIASGFDPVTPAAAPNHGPCPQYQGEDGRCTGDQPRNCTFEGKEGVCFTVTDHSTGNVSCRCFKKATQSVLDALEDTAGKERSDAATDVIEFDPEEEGEIAIDMTTKEIEIGAKATCIGMKFPHAWWPSGCNEAGYWGGCTMIAWRYPAGQYKKPDGTFIEWGGGHSPFKRTCN